MVDANRNNTSINNPGFGSVANPIAMMMEEHENEGDLKKLWNFQTTTHHLLMLATHTSNVSKCYKI